MNKSYMYANGNIHVFTNKKNKDVIEYVDGFEEKLISQNRLEVYENLIFINESNIEDYLYDIKYESLDSLIRIGACTMTGYAIPLFIDYFCKLDFSYLNMNLNQIIFITAVIGLIFGIHECYINLIKIKHHMLEIKARKKCREKLADKYNQEQTIYEKYPSKNTKNLEDIYYNERFIIKELGSDELEKNLKDYFVCNLWYEKNKKDFIKKYKTNEFFSSYNGLVDMKRLELIECMIKEDISKNKKGKQYVKSK